MKLLLLAVALILMTVYPARAQTASQLYSQSVQSYNQGDVEAAKRQLLLTLEVDKNFRPATALLNRIALEQQATKAPVPAATVSTKTLERMTVPVEFKDTSLQSALDYIHQRIESVSNGKMQVNFVLNLPPELVNKRITLQLDHAPVTELLRYLGELAGVNFQIQKYAVLVTPAAPTTAPTPTPAP